MTDETVDVIVRFHDVRRVRELRRCIFSLVGQTYRPIHIRLTTQRFDEAMIAETRKAVEDVLSIAGSPDYTIHNWAHAEPDDARSALINLGIENARGRYLAFLDYDDVLYPEAYELLIDQIGKSGAAIAFAGISVKQIEMFPNFSYTAKKTFPFNGKNLRSLFLDNFCPIHSFIVDVSAIPSQFLFFEPTMTKNEDYDFLIRLCAQFQSDFSLVKAIIGDYYLKSDGSNSILTASSASEKSREEWQRAEMFVEQRRRTTPLSAIVQRTLGIDPPIRGLTIRDFLDRGTNEASAA